MTIGAPPREAITACRDVVVAYGRGDAARRALDGVTLELSRSQSLALLGRSGSGKTTLLHVLGGLLEPTAGAVEWHGRPLSSLDRAARGAVRAHGIAYVFQGANLLPHFNAFENVAFAATVSGGRPRPWTARAARARRACREGGPLARGALGRRGAAGSTCARARAGAGAPPLRRADRPSRLGHRRARARPDRRASTRAWFRACRRDARPRRCRAAQARGRAARRTHRARGARRMTA